MSFVLSCQQIGVELAERTGINPSYSYLQLGCSKGAEHAMLNFARAQIGKPFSSVGMARALLWPRKSDHRSWFCAELVAACLQAGGLMNASSSPGAATPSSLYKLYKGRGAVAANPCTLRRQFQDMTPLKVNKLNLLGLKGNVTFNSGGILKSQAYMPVSSQVYQRKNSPPRMSFKQLASSSTRTNNNNNNNNRFAMIPITMTSLDMSNVRR